LIQVGSTVRIKSQEEIQSLCVWSDHLLCDPDLPRIDFCRTEDISSGSVKAEGMEIHCGKTTTIAAEDRDGGFRLAIDDRRHCWSAKWLEEVV